MRFEAGQTCVRRNVFRGKVWSAWPFRVLHDTDAELAGAIWPGTTLVSQRSPRERHLREVVEGVDTLGPDRLEGTTILAFHLPERWFSVMLFWRPDAFRHWYVNFERPLRRSSLGVDTWDLTIDLVIPPDRTPRWKDEDEYAEARSLGTVSDADHAAIQVAADEAVGMFDRGEGPFDERWLSWRPDPAWPVPVLPANALTEDVPSSP